MTDRLSSPTKVRLFTTSGTWIEGESLRQVERVASFAGAVQLVGFPDLHPGKGTPIGVSVLTRGEFYPHLVGSDVGCGVGLFSTDLAAGKAKPERWFKKLKGLDEPWEGDTGEWLEERRAEPVFLDAAGTIGHGNHFAELVRVAEVRDGETFSHLGLEQNRLFLIVHSGSRGLGESLLREHTGRFRESSLRESSEEAAAYMTRHDRAVLWAHASRELIARRLLGQLDSGYGPVLDSCHNSVTCVAPDYYLHRKGAARSDRGPLVIPGSRGAYSYLVAPVGDQQQNLWSVAHGAGRKWKRSECKDRLRDRHTAASLSRTKMGSYVICEDRELLYEEAPEAYKNIEGVIEDMVSFGLIRVIASFCPVLTYKERGR